MLSNVYKRERLRFLQYKLAQVEVGGNVTYLEAILALIL